MEVRWWMVFWIDVDAKPIDASDKLPDEVQAAIRPNVVATTQKLFQRRQRLLDARSLDNFLVQLVGKESHCGLTQR